MNKQPTYDELKQRVSELEEQAAMHKKTLESLQDAEEKFRT